MHMLGTRRSSVYSRCGLRRRGGHRFRGFGTILPGWSVGDQAQSTIQASEQGEGTTAAAIGEVVQIDGPSDGASKPAGLDVTGFLANGGDVFETHPLFSMVGERSSSTGTIRSDDPALVSDSGADLVVGQHAWLLGVFTGFTGTSARDTLPVVVSLGQGETLAVEGNPDEEFLSGGSFRHQILHGVVLEECARI
jgi:hypothetical protein